MRRALILMALLIASPIHAAGVFGGGVAQENLRTTFAGLAAVRDAGVRFCTNCNEGSFPCTSGGSGAFAFRIGSAWACPTLSATAGGSGDFSSNTATSVDGEVVVFSGTGGKTGKRATGTGLAFFTSGVASVVAGSTTANGGIALVNQSAAAIPLSITGAASQSGDLLDITANGGAAGGLFKVTSVGAIVAASTLTTANGITSAPAVHGSDGTSGVWFSGNNTRFAVGGQTNVIIAGIPSIRFSTGDAVAFSSTSDPAGSLDLSISRTAPGVQAIGTGATGNTAGFFRYGGTCVVATDQTNATTTPQTAACYQTTSGSVPISLAAGRSYSGVCELFLSDSVSADGAAMDFDASTATATTFRAQITAFDTALNLSSQTSALATDAAATTFSGSGAFEIHFFIKVNAAGTFQPRFFQNAHTTGTLTEFAGGHCVLTDVTP